MKLFILLSLLSTSYAQLPPPACMNLLGCVTIESCSTTLLNAFLTPGEELESTLLENCHCYEPLLEGECLENFKLCASSFPTQKIRVQQDLLAIGDAVCTGCQFSESAQAACDEMFGQQNPSGNQNEPNSGGNSKCNAVGGATCVWPFTVDGKQYQKECVQTETVPYCATEVDSNNQPTATALCNTGCGYASSTVAFTVIHVSGRTCVEIHDDIKGQLSENENLARFIVDTDILCSAAEPPENKIKTQGAVQLSAAFMIKIWTDDGVDGSGRMAAKALVTDLKANGLAGFELDADVHLVWNLELDDWVTDKFNACPAASQFGRGVVEKCGSELMDFLSQIEFETFHSCFDTLATYDDPEHASEEDMDAARQCVEDKLSDPNFSIGQLLPVTSAALEANLHEYFFQLDRFGEDGKRRRECRCALGAFLASFDICDAENNFWYNAIAVPFVQEPNAAGVPDRCEPQDCTNAVEPDVSNCEGWVLQLPSECYPICVPSMYDDGDGDFQKIDVGIEVFSAHIIKGCDEPFDFTVQMATNCHGLSSCQFKLEQADVSPTCTDHPEFFVQWKCAGEVDGRANMITRQASDDWVSNSFDTIVIDCPGLDIVSAVYGEGCSSTVTDTDRARTLCQDRAHCEIDVPGEPNGECGYEITYNCYNRLASLTVPAPAAGEIAQLTCNTAQCGPMPFAGHIYDTDACDTPSTNPGEVAMWVFPNKRPHNCFQFDDGRGFAYRYTSDCVGLEVWTTVTDCSGDANATFHFDGWCTEIPDTGKFGRFKPQWYHLMNKGDTPTNEGGEHFVYLVVHDELQVGWKVHMNEFNEKRVTFRVRSANPGGWTALGFKNVPCELGNGMCMADLDTIMLLQQSTTHSPCTAIDGKVTTNQQPPEHDANNDVECSGVHEGDGWVTYEFSRITRTGDDKDVDLTDHTYLYWAMRYEDDNDQMPHQEKGRFDVALNFEVDAMVHVTLTDTEKGNNDCQDDPIGHLADLARSCATDDALMYGCGKYDYDFEGVAVWMWELCPRSCRRCAESAAKLAAQNNQYLVAEPVCGPMHFEGYIYDTDACDTPSTEPGEVEMWEFPYAVTEDCFQFDDGGRGYSWKYTPDCTILDVWTTSSDCDGDSDTAFDFDGQCKEIPESGGKFGKIEPKGWQLACIDDPFGFMNAWNTENPTQMIHCEESRCSQDFDFGDITINYWQACPKTCGKCDEFFVDDSDKNMLVDGHYQQADGEEPGDPDQCADDPLGYIAADTSKECDNFHDGWLCESFDSDFNGVAVWIWELCPNSCHRCGESRMKLAAQNNAYLEVGACIDDPFGLLMEYNTNDDHNQMSCDNVDCNADYSLYQYHMKGRQLCPKTCEGCGDFFSNQLEGGYYKSDGDDNDDNDDDRYKFRTHAAGIAPDLYGPSLGTACGAYPQIGQDGLLLENLEPCLDIWDDDERKACVEGIASDTLFGPDYLFASQTVFETWATWIGQDTQSCSCGLWTWSKLFEEPHTTKKARINDASYLAWIVSDLFATNVHTCTFNPEEECGTGDCQPTNCHPSLTYTPEDECCAVCQDQPVQTNLCANAYPVIQRVENLGTIVCGEETWDNALHINEDTLEQCWIGGGQYSKSCLLEAAESGTIFTVSAEAVLDSLIQLGTECVCTAATWYNAVVDNCVYRDNSLGWVIFNEVYAGIAQYCASPADCGDCEFPYVYQGQVRRSCVDRDGEFMCPLKANGVNEADHDPTNWVGCDECCEQPSSASCTESECPRGQAVAMWDGESCETCPVCTDLAAVALHFDTMDCSADGDEDAIRQQFVGHYVDRPEQVLLYFDHRSSTMCTTNVGGTFTGWSLYITLTELRRQDVKTIIEQFSLGVDTAVNVNWKFHSATEALHLCAADGGNTARVHYGGSCGVAATDPHAIGDLPWVNKEKLWKCLDGNLVAGGDCDDITADGKEVLLGHFMHSGKNFECLCGLAELLMAQDDCDTGSLSLDLSYYLLLPVRETLKEIVMWAENKNIITLSGDDKPTCAQFKDAVGAYLTEQGVDTTVGGSSGDDDDDDDDDDDEGNCTDNQFGVVVNRNCANVNQSPEFSCGKYDHNFNGHSVWIWELCPKVCGRCKENEISLTRNNNQLRSTSPCMDDPFGVVNYASTENVEWASCDTVVCTNVYHFGDHQAEGWQLCPKACGECAKFFSDDAQLEGGWYAHYDDHDDHPSGDDDDDDDDDDIPNEAKPSCMPTVQCKRSWAEANCHEVQAEDKHNVYCKVPSVIELFTSFQCPRNKPIYDCATGRTAVWLKAQITAGHCREIHL